METSELKKAALDLAIRYKKLDKDFSDILDIAVVFEKYLSSAPRSTGQ